MLEIIHKIAKLCVCGVMLMVTMNIPHLLLKVFYDKVLNVGKVCIRGFFFPKIFIDGVHW